jgi:hypothetical protein
MAEEKYRCNSCNRDFASKEGFDQHNRDKHGMGKEKKPEKVVKTADAREKAIEKAVKKRKTMRILKYAIPVILIIAVVGAAIVYLPKNNNSTEIGPLGSTHIHAELAVYINGAQLRFNENKYFEGELHERYTHLHAPHDTLVHVHATRVTIGRFMNGIDVPFNATCITDKNGERLCNDGANTLKFYVNGEENPAFDKYVIKDKDKILISYGNYSEEQIKEQIDSITDFAVAASQGLIGG